MTAESAPTPSSGYLALCGLLMPLVREIDAELCAEALAEIAAEGMPSEDGTDAPVSQTPQLDSAQIAEGPDACEASGPSRWE